MFKNKATGISSPHEVEQWSDLLHMLGKRCDELVPKNEAGNFLWFPLFRITGIPGLC